MDDKKHIILNIPRKSLERLPVYYHYLKDREREGTANISSPFMAQALELNEVQVRKDLAMVTRSGGRPKTGYPVRELIEDIEGFLGYRNVNQAVLAGAGSLGRALLSYKGFEQYGLEIVMAFDSDRRKTEKRIDGKAVLHVDKLADLCRRMNILIGIITVPAQAAQEVCDRMVEGGVRAIWNFAPVHLNAPERVLIQNENMAVSLAALSKYLKETETCG